MQDNVRSGFQILVRSCKMHHVRFHKSLGKNLQDHRRSDRIYIIGSRKISFEFIGFLYQDHKRTLGILQEYSVRIITDLACLDRNSHAG